MANGNMASWVDYFKSSKAAHPSPFLGIMNDDDDKHRENYIKEVLNYLFDTSDKKGIGLSYVDGEVRISYFPKDYLQLVLIIPANLKVNNVNIYERYLEGNI